jgi:hypothetical protein
VTWRWCRIHSSGGRKPAPSGSMCSASGESSQSEYTVVHTVIDSPSCRIFFMPLSATLAILSRNFAIGAGGKEPRARESYSGCMGERGGTRSRSKCRTPSVAAKGAV